jgi:hypothetical protein
MLLTPLGTVNSCSPAVLKLTVSAVASDGAAESKATLATSTAAPRGVDPPVID